MDAENNENKLAQGPIDAVVPDGDVPITAHAPPHRDAMVSAVRTKKLTAVFKTEKLLLHYFLMRSSTISCHTIAALPHPRSCVLLLIGAATQSR